MVCRSKLFQTMPPTEAENKSSGLVSECCNPLSLYSLWRVWFVHPLRNNNYRINPMLRTFSTIPTFSIIPVCFKQSLSVSVGILDSERNRARSRMLALHLGYPQLSLKMFHGSKTFCKHIILLQENIYLSLAVPRVTKPIVFQLSWKYSSQLHPHYTWTTSLNYSSFCLRAMHNLYDHFTYYCNVFSPM